MVSSGGLSLQKIERLNPKFKELKLGKIIKINEVVKSHLWLYNVMRC